MPHAMPTTRATTRPMRAVPQPSPPMASITFAATTEENTSTEPTDRSMPEVMMTKVIPTPMHGPHGDVLGDQREVAGGEELAAAGDGEEDDDDQQHAEDPHRLQAAQPLEQRFTGRDDRRPGSRSGRGRSGEVTVQPPSRRGAFASSAPVMAPTSCSTVVPSAGMVAMRVPRRMTWMRLATSSTAGIECEIRTTAMPLSLTRLIVSSTFLVWTTPRAAVGSSRNMILLAQVMDRTIAICCRCPPDIDADLGAAVARTVPPRSANPALAFCAHGLLVHEPEPAEHALPRDLPAQEHVLDGVEVRREREVLVDDLHAHAGRLLRGS